jgi:hypothetical protein
LIEVFPEERKCYKRRDRRPDSLTKKARKNDSTSVRGGQTILPTIHSDVPPVSSKKYKIDQ